MRKKLFFVCSIFIALTMVLTAASPFAAQQPASVSIAVAATKFDAHYRVPNEGKIELLLEQDGIFLENLSQSQRLATVQAYQEQFNKMNPDTPNLEKYNKLLKQELEGINKKSAMAMTAAALPERPIKSLVTLVEFPNADTFLDGCGVEVTTSGPLHNEIDPPGPRDNNTVWYEDSSPELYEELYFAEGPTAGVIVNHPNLGPVDLRGSTMANYYLEQSNGKFGVAGEVYPKWFQATHSEGYYGADSCDGGSHNVRAGDLVAEVIDMVNADAPDFAWQDFDGDGDGEVDNFTVIHAGEGQESGGGEQGDFSIWSHASLIDWPSGKLVCTAGSAGCPDRNIYVLHYSMDPEHIDVGVISEEFGHAAFGLPDIYTTDAQASVSNWAIMEAGSWNGPLGGMLPAPFPLWFRYLLGWAEPKEIDYADAKTITEIGQLSGTPKNKVPGLKINLPPTTTEVANPLGTGNAWWSDVGNGLTNTLTREVDLTLAANPLLTFATYWSIEEDWDYGYVKVSTDGGATWTFLQDMDGFTTDTDPNGNSQGWGLTGEGMEILRFDLTPYVGGVVQIQFEYSTDTAVQEAGWWVDDLAISDGDTVLFSDDVEGDGAGWMADGWVLTPLVREYPRYYLAEWRNSSGFDKGLAYPYQTVYNDVDEWEVDRTPYTVPGLVLYLRDTAYATDYTLNDSTSDAPSMGPKHALLVVDSHYFPYEWDDYKYASGAGYRLGARAQPGNSAFTLQPTTAFTARLGIDPATGTYVEEPLQTKTFGPLPAVSQFHDSLGYYPGLLFAENGGLYYWDRPASVVIPAKDNYTTRITWVDQTPVYDLYGADLGTTILGSGNPGDEGVQFGFHLAVIKKNKDGSTGTVVTWNSQNLFDISMKVNETAIRAGRTLAYTITFKNPTPVTQKFTLYVPVPEGTTYVSGEHFNAQQNAIVWEGSMVASATANIKLKVLVPEGTPKDTVIDATAYIYDEAVGNSASVSSTVK